MTAGRTALLVRCSQKEAELIRQACKLERRTQSGYVLNAVFEHIVRKTNPEATDPEQRP